MSSKRELGLWTGAILVSQPEVGTELIAGRTGTSPLEILPSAQSQPINPLESHRHLQERMSESGSIMTSLPVCPVQATTLPTLRTSQFSLAETSRRLSLARTFGDSSKRTLR